MRHFLRLRSIPTLPVSVTKFALPRGLVLAARSRQRRLSSCFSALVGAVGVPPVASRAEPKLRSAPPADHAGQLCDFLALPEHTWEKPSVATTPGVPADLPNQSGH